MIGRNPFAGLSQVDPEIIAALAAEEFRTRLGAVAELALQLGEKGSIAERGARLLLQRRLERERDYAVRTAITMALQDDRRPEAARQAAEKKQRVEAARRAAQEKQRAEAARQAAEEKQRAETARGCESADHPKIARTAEGGVRSKSLFGSGLAGLGLFNSYRVRHDGPKVAPV